MTEDEAFKLMSERLIEKEIKNNNIEPLHYTTMKISPLEYIEGNGIDYILGNVIKYVSRYERKNGLEDLKKARWYLEHKITQMESGQHD